MKYIYTNRSTSEELDRFQKDLFNSIEHIYAQGTSRAFDVVEKVGESGFYSATPLSVFDALGLDLPDYRDYTGLYETDDVSEWQVDEVLQYSNSAMQ